MMNQLRVNSIESFSTKDGDGIRSVIFLQGCPLRCLYCHNPETWEVNAGELYDVDVLARKILRFKDYWGQHGGVTLSGGEPLAQAKNLVQFVKFLKKQNVNIAIDTSGAVVNKDVEKVLGCCDQLILDIKDIADLRLLEIAEKIVARILIRIVIVPGINDTEEKIREYALKLKGRKIERVELVAFHTLGFEKYKNLGLQNPLENTKPCSIKRLCELQRCFDSII